MKIGKWNLHVPLPWTYGYKGDSEHHTRSSQEYVPGISFAGSSALLQEGHHVSFPPTGNGYNSNRNISYLSLTLTWCWNADTRPLGTPYRGQHIILDYYQGITPNPIYGLTWWGMHHEYLAWPQIPSQNSTATGCWEITFINLTSPF